MSDKAEQPVTVETVQEGIQVDLDKLNPADSPIALPDGSVLTATEETLLVDEDGAAYIVDDTGLVGLLPAGMQMPVGARYATEAEAEKFQAKHKSRK